jgi:stage II sporulation protein D
LKILNFLFLVLFTKLNILHCNIFIPPKKSKNVFVKVLLNQRNSKFKSQIKIESQDPFLLETPYISKKMLIKDKSTTLKIVDNKIKLPMSNLDKIQLKTIDSNELRIFAQNSSIKLNGTSYQGTIILKIIPKDNTLYIINKILLDDYIYSVLVSEIYQTWPEEMQKVQAVVSRTYAIYHMKQNQNRSKKLTYDIKKSNFHQRYTGYHKYKHLKDAIEQTKGIIATYDNKIALTMFDACCGGIVPAQMDYLDFKKAPYLARKTSCNYCKNYSLYSWNKNISTNEFMQKLKNNHAISSQIIGCGDLSKILVTKKDNAGIVKQIRLICTKKNINLTGNQLWDSMKDTILSKYFSISKTNDKIQINGKGYGHQMGLCQRGARELVKQGWDFKKIIKFYYPGITFSKLNYAKI